MKLVYKCDHCSHTDSDEEEMAAHEKACGFNPVNKKCYSCEHQEDHGYNGCSDPACGVNANVDKGMDEGNCESHKEIIDYSQK